MPAKPDDPLDPKNQQAYPSLGHLPLSLQVFFELVFGFFPPPPIIYFIFSVAPFLAAIFGNTKKCIIFGNTKYVNPPESYTLTQGGAMVRKRKLPLGDKNMAGARVTEARNRLGLKQVDLLSRLQTAGIDISTPALSLLEGQKRPVTDFELAALADILSVSVDWLLGRE